MGCRWSQIEGVVLKVIVPACVDRVVIPGAYDDAGSKPARLGDGVAGEIRKLRWSQVDLSEAFLTVGKSKTDAGTGCPIPLNLAAKSALTDWGNRFPGHKPEHYVFPQCETKKIDRSKTTKGWRQPGAPLHALWNARNVGAYNHPPRNAATRHVRQTFTTSRALWQDSDSMTCGTPPLRSRLSLKPRTRRSWRSPVT